MLEALPDDRHRDVYRVALDFANSESLRQRIEWLADRAQDLRPDWDVDTARLAQQVSQTRNWLVHWGRRGSHVREGKGLADLTGKLYFLLVVNVLLDLGMDEEAAAQQVAWGFAVEGALP